MTRSCSASRACLLGAALTLASLGATAQANLGFLRDSPLARFNAEDLRLMLDAGRVVLESKEPNAVQSWSNKKTRHAGRVASLRRFSFEQRDCQRLRVETRARGMESQTTLSVCHVEGAWKVDTKAQPPAR